MNIYFLVEGRRTEMKVYPKWLSFLLPKLNRVRWYHEVVENNYCIFTGDGFPSLLDNHFKNSVEDINLSGKFDYFIICLDADDDSVETRRKDVIDFISRHNIQLIATTQLVIVVQNKCIETWFLGNQKIFKNNPESSDLLDFINYYNVKNQDPELMGKPFGFEGNTADFHCCYLQEIFAERNIRYSKKNPQGVTEKYYLDELIKRSRKTKQIRTFEFFIDLCVRLDAEMGTH